MKKETAGFFVKVTVYHIITYIVCGIFFSTVLDYESVWQSGVFPVQMRDYNSNFTYLGPVFQIIRGLLFAGILYLIPKDFFRTKFAWLKTWVVIAGIGIINTPGPAMGSIEGFIYTVTPLKTLIYCIEVYVQTLWFSILVCGIDRPKKTAVFEKFKFPVLAAAAVVFSVMASGILLLVLLKLDFSVAQNDIGAVAVLFAGAALAFFSALLYGKSPSKGRFGILLAVAFVSAGVMPTAYNYFTGSPLRTPLTLFPGLFCAGLVICIVKALKIPSRQKQ
jgi:hypothetical protein